MRSELFRIPMEWGAIPLFGMGLLLGLWIFIAVGWLVWQSRQQEWIQELWGFLTPIGLVAAVIALLPLFFPEGVPIRGYGVMLLSAILTGLAMAVYRAKQRGVDADTVLSLTFWLFVFGIAGARLFFVIEYWESRFADQPFGSMIIDVLRFTEGGLVVYGSLIGATIAFIGFCYRHKLPTLMMADVLAPSLAAGLALGRLGCLLNGCCYGGACDLPWAITFPEGSPPFMDQLVHGRLHGIELVESPDGGPLLLFTENSPPQKIVAINGYEANDLNDSASLIAAAHTNHKSLNFVTEKGKRIEIPASTYERSLSVHPTQIYSAINAALIAWFLWAYYPSRRRDGEVVLLLLTIYPISRFLLEIIRTDEAAIFGTGLSISQNVSLLIFLIVIAGWWFLPKVSHQRANFFTTSSSG